MYDRILIPLDGSERAEAILTHLEPVFRASDAEVTLLGVVDPRDGGKETRAAAVSRAESYLVRIVNRLRDAGLDVDQAVREGRPSEVIVSFAAEYKSRLVALASHGYGGLDRLFYGSTAERVLRSATTPLLLVRSQSALGRVLPLEPISWNNVLVPLDGSPAAERALDHASFLAGLQGARIHLVRVIARYPRTGYYAPLDDGGSDGSDEQRYLESIAARLSAEGRTVETAVSRGVVPDVLREYVTTNAIDLVALTSHGRSGWSSWFLGNVAEDLLRHVDTPLLVERTPPAM